MNPITGPRGSQRLQLRQGIGDRMNMFDSRWCGEVERNSSYKTIRSLPLEEFLQIDSVSTSRRRDRGRHLCLQ
jgi:hypothetical protein